MTTSTTTNGTHTNGSVVKSRPSPSTLAHVVLRTTPENYEAMKQFHVDLLNAEIVHSTPVLTFIRYDHEHHRIALVAAPGSLPKPKDVGHVGLDHIAFTFSTLTALAQNYVWLRDNTKWRPLWTTNHGPTTSMYYRDPDGNKIELQVDNFEIPEEADAFMKGPKYDENPIGTDFDADTWAAEILSKALPNGQEGLSAEEVKERKSRVDVGTRHQLPDDFL